MLYTVTELFDGLTLKKAWTTLDLGTGNHSGHLIAIKSADKPVAGKIDHTKVVGIILERAYETGINNCPAIVETIALTFNEWVSTDEDINKRVAFRQFEGYAEKCYVRVKEIIVEDPTEKDLEKRAKIYSIYNEKDLGKSVAIDINVAPLKFE